MRMLMLVRLPVEPFNSMVRDGTAGPLIEEILEDSRPEGVWFTELHGQRTGVLVVQVDGAGDVPRLAEPWFLHFEADVEFRIAMTPEDLASAGLEELGRRWS